MGETVGWLVVFLEVSSNVLFLFLLVIEMSTSSKIHITLSLKLLYFSCVWGEVVCIMCLFSNYLSI